MQSAPIPTDEPSRLEALHQTDVLDTPPETAFDQLTWLASKICGVPVALITLVDTHRQWFKSHQGIDILETPRDVALCAYTILRDDLFVVPDATQDHRFADNPLVAKEPKIRFYAGAPLTTADGHGHWERTVEFPSAPRGETFTVTVSGLGGSKSFTFTATGGDAGHA